MGGHGPRARRREPRSRRASPAPVHARGTPKTPRTAGGNVRRHPPWPAGSDAQNGPGRAPVVVRARRAVVLAVELARHSCSGPVVLVLVVIRGSGPRSKGMTAATVTTSPQVGPGRVFDVRANAGPTVRLA